MHTVSMKCNEQERRALYGWLINHDYSCNHPLNTVLSSFAVPAISNNELFVNCEKKTFEWWGYVHSVFATSNRVKTLHDHVECKNITQLIGVVQTIESMPKYDIGASVDFLLEHAPEALNLLLKSEICRKT